MYTMKHIIENIKKGKYKNTVPYFDRENYTYEENSKREFFHKDMISALKENYKLNNSQAEKVYQSAWKDSYSRGYCEIVFAAERYMKNYN